MTIREFLKVIDGNKSIIVSKHGKIILKIDTCYLEQVKEKLLDMEIEEKGIYIHNNYSFEIRIK